MNRNRLSSQQPKAALKLGSAATIETGSPKGFPETRKPQASAESRERSDHYRAATIVAKRPLSDKEGCATTDTALKWFLRDCPSQYL